jgi:hypothetical protein
MKRMRLVAYFVYVYTVPRAYKLEDGCFLVPRVVHNRIVRFDP